ncbi:hypothetical protein GJ496_006057 [Pomphorhynchus laevis]|nr:hypothetical protein GJ496_006057 [Pomphorhynchus laevis]
MRHVLFKAATKLLARAEPRIAAVCAYSIVKYGLFGYIYDLEKDGRWDAVEVPNPAVLSARNELNFDAALVRQILTVVLSTKVSFSSTNHHVGQDGTTEYLKKVLDLFAMSGDNLINTLDNAGHWAGTIRHRIDTADHIQGRVLGRLGAFASIFYSETSLFKSPAVNGPDGKRYTSYEDYDSEFSIKLAQLKRVKISDEIMAQLTTNRQFNEPELIDRISQILVAGFADESRRSGRGTGPVVNVPSVGAGEII